MERAKELVSDLESADEQRTAALVRTSSPAVPAQVLYSDRQVEPKNNLAEIILFSIGALFAGLLFSTKNANEANRLLAQSQKMEAESVSIMKVAAFESQEQARRLMQHGLLSQKGVPVAGIMAQLVQAVSPNITFSKVAVSSKREVRVEGEAKTEQAMMQGLERMRQGEAVRDLKLAGFRHPDPSLPALRFAIVGKAISSGDTKR